MLYICCIYVVYMLYICCIYVVYMLYICCIYVVYMCCIYIYVCVWCMYVCVCCYIFDNHNVIWYHIKPCQSYLSKDVSLLLTRHCTQLDDFSAVETELLVILAVNRIKNSLGCWSLRGCHSRSKWHQMTSRFGAAQNENWTKAIELIHLGFPLYGLELISDRPHMPHLRFRGINFLRCLPLRPRASRTVFMFSIHTASTGPSYGKWRFFDREKGWKKNGNLIESHPVILLWVLRCLAVDGRNPAPVDRWLIPLFLGFQHVSTIQGGRISQPSTVCLIRFVELMTFEAATSMIHWRWEGSALAV